MTNPYEILEINANATDEEVKKAYRELAKKYHPDNFKDNPLSDLANEKMKSINEAYDAIQKERAYGSGSYKSYGGGAEQNGNYYNNSNNTASNFPRIRELIINRRFSEAEIMLDAAETNERNAEWFYLKGVLMGERGWFFDAQKHFETAHKMEPDNGEYRDAFNSIKNKSQNFYQNGGYNTSRRQKTGCSGCDICTGLLCADCCCECCGGDLISCC